MKTKVVVFSDYPEPNSIIQGGVPRAVCNIYDEFSSTNSDFEIHICSFSSINSITIQKNKNLFIHYFWIPFVKYPILIPSILCKFYIKKIIGQIKPDLIHVESINKFYADPVVKLNFFPVIITINGIIFQESKSWTGILGYYRSLVGKKMETRILKNAIKLIAISHYVKKEIAEKTDAEIQIIVDPMFFGVKKHEVKNRILFVGGIEPRKGLHILFEAITLVKPTIPDIRVHIVGSVRKKDYFSKILQIIKKNELDDFIVFRGALDDNELLKEYSQAAIFILPSKEESLGIVLLEAMATRTPLIASNIGGIPNIIHDGQNGFLVNYGDTQKIAEHIINLLSNDELRSKMGNIGEKMAREYHPEKIAKKHKEYYDIILNNCK